MSQFYTGMLVGGCLGFITGVFGLLLVLCLCQTAARESVYCRGRKHYFEIAPTQPDYDTDCVDDVGVGRGKG